MKEISVRKNLTTVFILLHEEFTQFQFEEFLATPSQSRVPCLSRAYVIWGGCAMH